MKKIATLLFLLCLLTALAACGAPNTGAAGITQAANGGGNQSAVAVPSGEQYSFTYNGTEIELYAPAEPIVDALGEPMKYSESTSCAFDGLDKSYYYGSFYLETYPDGDKDFVYGWWFKDDTVTTEEGIYIGSTQEAVEAAYGADAFNGSNAYIVDKNQGRLTVILEEGIVTSIQYAIITTP